MEKTILTIPTLYGDHHTTAVRQILEAIKGVSSVFVSSASRQVAITFDPKVVKVEAIAEALAAKGYAEDSPDLAYATSIRERATRHTAAFSGSGNTVSFTETAPAWTGRPLWPCPGLEYRPSVFEEEES